MQNDNKRRELVVSAIQNGTVIDHIPAKSVFRVMRMLNLEQIDTQITVGMNLESHKYGRKGIIKVSGQFFENEAINKIALIAPSASMIVIKDYEVVEKRNVEIPDEITRIVRCVNPNCITNHQSVATRFKVIDKKELKLQCHFCEKITGKNNIDIL